MRHRAAFVSLSIMYPNLAYSALNVVGVLGVDSGIRWEQEVWKNACFGGITVIAAQRLLRSQLMTSKMMQIMFSKWFNVLHST